MANIDSVATYTSSTGLTTASVASLFNVSDVHNFEATKAECLVTMAAETGLQLNATTGATIYVPLFSVKSGTFLPTRLIAQRQVAVTFGGTDAATATLGAAIAVGTTPSSGAVMGGTANTPIITATNTSSLVSLVTAGGTGTNVMAAGQFINTTLALTSTNAMTVKPGQTAYLALTVGGTLTTANLTVTGAFRFFVAGDEQFGA